MKTAKVFAIAAATLTMGFASCTKENGAETPSANKFKVTLNFKNAATRADGALAVAGTKVGIVDGYICFVSPGNTITDVYTIGAAATDLGNKKIQNSDLGSVPVTLDNVPGTSSKVYMIANTGANAAISAPVVGSPLANFMEKNLEVRDQSDYTKVTSTGSASLVDSGVTGVKNATISLATGVSRIQIKNICFDKSISGTVAGIFVNGYYPTMQINGTGNTWQASNDKTDYVSGSSIFPTLHNTYVYDMVNKAIGTTVTPGNDVWGYNLFASATPQIIIKLTGVMIEDIPLSGDQFVTINGLKDGNTTIDKIAGGMIYTIKNGTLVINPEHITTEPGVTPFTVNVTVEQVEWQETEVIPVM